MAGYLVGSIHVLVEDIILLAHYTRLYPHHSHRCVNSFVPSISVPLSETLGTDLSHHVLAPGPGKFPRSMYNYILRPSMCVWN